MDGFGLKIQFHQDGDEYGDNLPADNSLWVRVTLVFAGREIQSGDTYLPDLPQKGNRLLEELVKLVRARQQLRGAFGDDVVNVV